MTVASGLIALAMVAADGPSSDPYETTTYQVRVLTLDGLDWRTSSYSRLQPVCRQGTSTIWTADKALAASLLERATKATTPSSIMAVGEAELTRAEPVYYVASMDRIANGPIDQSSAIAFMPRPEQIEERFSIKVAGRKLDQGILTRIVLEDSHVDVIHQVKQSEAIKTSESMPSKVSRTPAQVGQEILNVVLAPSPTEPTGQRIATSIQIPESSHAKVDGEWLIPNEGVLLVSLGVKTASDDQGMAVVRERVAVIEARSGSATTPDPKSKLGVAQGLTKLDTRFVPVAQPAMPSRSLPQPVNPDGGIADLPPLPEALASTDLDRIKPEPNQPSPQAPIFSAPSTDSNLARTAFDAAPPAPKPPVEVTEADDDDNSIRLSEIIESLVKANVKLVMDVDAKNLMKATGASLEKCEGDTPFCPADAKVFKPSQIAGGFKYAPISPAPQLGLTVKDGNGLQILDGAANLDEVLKSPGRTETTVIPLGGSFSLEVKATVVPTSSDQPKATAKKADASTSKR